MTQAECASKFLCAQIAGELDLSDRDFLAIRSGYNHKREVLRNLPGGA